MILLGSIVEAAAVSFMSISRSPSSLMAAAVLCGLGVGFANSVGFALPSDVVSATSRRVAVGVANSFLQAGIAVVSTLMGFVKEVLGFKLMFQARALTIALGVALVSTLTRRKS